MKQVVDFQHVSKLYQRGLTRTSLPTMFGQKIRRALSPNARKTEPSTDLWALRDVSFALKQGECLGLVGANGAGKTTILKLLSRITTPTEGTIKLNGRLSALIELGAGFHPDLTGRENVFLNGTILGLSTGMIRSRFDEIVGFAEIGDFIDTPIKRYSSGMAVRLGFAVASCIEPDVLLVDEVLAVGDARFRQKCLKRIHRLLGQGTSIVFVSHNLYMVRAVCERALYLSKGKVKFAGKTPDAIAAYERAVHLERVANLVSEDREVAPVKSCVDITDVRITGPSGRPSSDDLMSTEPATITLTYSSRRESSRVHFAVFIKREDGLTCCMIRTSTNGDPLSLPMGNGIVSIQLERLQLVSGAYTVIAHVLNESDSVVLNPNGVESDWFCVVGTVIGLSESSGVFEPVVDWRFEPVEQAGQLLDNSIAVGPSSSIRQTPQS